MNKMNDITDGEMKRWVDSGEYACHPALWPRPWAGDPRLLPENVDQARRRWFVSPVTGRPDADLTARLAEALGPKNLLMTRAMWNPSTVQTIRDGWVAEQLAK